MHSSALNTTPVPTNIITGFLGAGKTTSILHLLEQKPAQESWAVLVNEFGEIGIDGSLLKGSHSNDDGVFISEVPGGCMCCTAGISMQTALNELLRYARPDRLLIEPSGLGHPLEVLQVLASDEFSNVLSIQKVLTLVDARTLINTNYVNDPVFEQQLAIADVVVGNKTDCYHQNESDLLKDHVRNFSDPQTDVIFTTNGAIDIQLLAGYSLSVSAAQKHQTLAQFSIHDTASSVDGLTSVGWRFNASERFDHNRLYAFLSGLEVERMKAVFSTNAGVFAYNLSNDALTEMRLQSCLDSRIEIISHEVDDHWHAQLSACMTGAD
ncbi:MAG: GTP-binding protein [Pseudomonadota bacterium]